MTDPNISLAATSGDMVAWIEQILAHGIRRPGYPGDLAVESCLESAFKEFGLEGVSKEPVPVNRWEAQETWLQFPEFGSEVPCAAIPYTAWTPESGVESPCVFLGSAAQEDFEGKDLHGKIVVIEARFADFSASMLKANATHIHDPEGTIPDGVLHKANWLIANFPAYFEALARGAAGLIGLLVDAPIDGCDYWVPYDGFLKDLPAVWVGREHAGTVKALAHEGRLARLVSRGETAVVDSHNVVGWVKGRGEESILLTCHHDAPYTSAVEDASGLSVLLALAKTFGKHPGLLERNLLFVASSGHFHGGIGNRAFVERHREDWLAGVVAALGMEHIAHEVEGGPLGEYRLTGLPEVRALFAEGDLMRQFAREALRPGVLERSLVLPAYLFGPEPPCDSAPYFTAGISSLCHISGPLYLFDPEDTLDKVRIEDLEPAAAFFTELIQKIDQAPLADLERGLSRKRSDPPAPPPHWFLPREEYLRQSRQQA
jgi:hypothetical protein